MEERSDITCEFIKSISKQLYLRMLEAQKNQATEWPCCMNNCEK